MTFTLNDIRPTKQKEPWRMCLHGEHKVGKSTFGAASDAPIFIPTEDGLSAIDAHSFPLCSTWDEVIGAIGTLFNEQHDFKTVVLDSGDWAETLARKKVCEESGSVGIEDLGYGKGYTRAGELFHEALDGLNALRTERGMNVIVICHTEIKTFNDPLGNSYDRYQIKMHKIISKTIQQWCDVIAFCQNEKITKVEEGEGFKKDRSYAIDTSRRVMKLRPSAAYDAGNRYSLPESMPLDFAAFNSAMEDHYNG